MVQRSLLRAWAFAFLIASSAAGAQAVVSVAVDSGSYAGQWAVEGVSPFVTGTALLSLEPGTHRVRVGIVGEFLIDVSPAGAVSVQNGISGSGGAGTLAFVTTPVAVDPGAFSGAWAVLWVSDFATAPAALALVPGVDYMVAPGALGSFLFRVQADGEVAVPNGVSATGGPGTLAFHTLAVAIDVSGFEGEWAIAGILPFASGNRTPLLVPGARYFVFIGGAGGFAVAVATDGAASAENGISALGGPGSLAFQTLAVSVLLGDFEGDWFLSRVGAIRAGDQSVTLVRGIDYLIFVGGGNLANFSFGLDGSGVPQVHNAISAVGTTGSLRLSNTQITVAPQNPASFWQIPGVGAGPAIFEASGTAAVILVPGLGYGLRAHQEVGLFSVTEPCAVAPSSLQLGGNDFGLSCGIPDLDEDGVPDATDNCPDVPNPDQVDQDLDGIGNACDEDLDGDGFVNAADNCPEQANPDQADFDGDGYGDVCDADLDGDSVPDAQDNCPSIPNTGQSDSDADGVGDACDDDDDGDGVLDVADNCPVTFNPDQADFDSNGQGDVCDGDIDGDEVANAADSCALSPAGQRVNDVGCTGEQWIELRCNPAGFVQHGQLVSCVAHAANEAVSQGLIGASEKAGYVREAARRRN